MERVEMKKAVDAFFNNKRAKDAYHFPDYYDYCEIHGIFKRFPVEPLKKELLGRLGEDFKLCLWLAREEESHIKAFDVIVELNGNDRGGIGLCHASPFIFYDEEGIVTWAAMQKKRGKKMAYMVYSIQASSNFEENRLAFEMREPLFYKRLNEVLIYPDETPVPLSQCMAKSAAKIEEEED